MAGNVTAEATSPLQAKWTTRSMRSTRARCLALYVITHAARYQKAADCCAHSSPPLRARRRRFLAKQFTRTKWAGRR